MKSALSIVSLLILFILPQYPEAPQDPSLRDFRLDNGLQVLVFEDHSTPFVRLDLAFRAGAIAQGSENSGYFHLLEHLLLEGGVEGSRVAMEIEKLAPLDWNGETGAEFLAFNMKIPSTEIDAGLAIWGKMVLAKTFDPDSFAAAQKRVGDEALAQASNPSLIYEGAMTRRLFPKYPWRRDPAGNPASIAAASAEGLAKLKSLWILPSNAVLIITGDVDATTIVASVKAGFSAWSPGPSPWKASLPPQPKLGVARPTWFFLADPRVPEGTALAEIRYRGPDLLSDLPSSLAADLWTSLLAVEGGRFAKAMTGGVPGLQGQAQVAYISQKEGGLISVNAAIDIGKPGNLLDRVRAFKESFRGNEVTSMRNNPSYFGAADFDAARARLLAERLAALDTIDGRAKELVFAWTSSSLDYYNTYESRIAATGPKEVGFLLDTWILHNLEVVALRLNPADLEREGKTLSGGGFESVKAGGSFWWQGR